MIRALPLADEIAAAKARIAALPLPAAVTRCPRCGRLSCPDARRCRLWGAS